MQNIADYDRAASRDWICSRKALLSLAPAPDRLPRHDGFYFILPARHQ